MTTTPSDDLRAFLQSWLGWAEGNAPQGEPYFRTEGLCLALHDFARQRHGGVPAHGVSAECDALTDALTAELTDLFEATLGGRAEPFPGYWMHAHEGTQHESPERLAWVRKILAQGD